MSPGEQYLVSKRRSGVLNTHEKRLRTGWYKTLSSSLHQWASRTEHPGRAVQESSVMRSLDGWVQRLTRGMAQQRARWPIAAQVALKLSALVTTSGAEEYC